MLQVHVRLSVVSTGTATVSTGTRGLYLATSLPVLPPRVNTTIKLAWTWPNKQQAACNVSVKLQNLSTHMQKLQ